MTDQELIAYAQALEYKSTHPRQFFEPYDYQLEMFEAGKSHPERSCLWGNQIGKTYSAMFEVACHLTGDYPSWWNGHVFEHPPEIIVCGKSNESMKDTTFRLLCGQLMPLGRDYTTDNEGFIRAEEILDYEKAQGQMMFKDCKIKHKKGTALLSFRSYEQGHMSIAGRTVDMIAIDEEPATKSIEFYAQCTMRVFKKKGLILITATPEHGETELVSTFLNSKSPTQWMTHKGWDDAPHYTEEDIQAKLASIPAYQHKMRRYGLPTFVEGLVYPVDLDTITVDDKPIPEHWKTLCAVDFGWNDPTCFIKIAYDEATDTMYVVQEYGKSEEVPSSHALYYLRVHGQLPCVYPHDGNANGKDGSAPLAKQYQELGVNMFIESRNPDGSNSIDAGVFDILERMQTGRFFIFKSCQKLLGELRKYRRNGKTGRPIDADDHYCDSMRYCARSIQMHGVTQGSRSGWLSESSNIRNVW